MAEGKDFTIARLDWLVKLKGAHTGEAQFRRELWVLVNFLQQERLTSRIVARDEADISTDFALRRSDLTELGYVVIQKYFNRWLDRLDKGRPPEDLTVLRNGLAKLRKLTAKTENA